MEVAEREGDAAPRAREGPGRAGNAPVLIERAGDVGVDGELSGRARGASSSLQWTSAEKSSGRFWWGRGCVAGAKKSRGGCRCGRPVPERRAPGLQPVLAPWAVLGERAARSGLRCPRRGHRRWRRSMRESWRTSRAPAARRVLGSSGVCPAARLALWGFRRLGRAAASAQVLAPGSGSGTVTVSGSWLRRGCRLWLGRGASGSGAGSGLAARASIERGVALSVRGRAPALCDALPRLALASLLSCVARAKTVPRARGSRRLLVGGTIVA